MGKIKENIKILRNLIISFGHVYALKFMKMPKNALFFVHFYDYYFLYDLNSMLSTEIIENNKENDKKQTTPFVRRSSANIHKLLLNEVRMIFAFFSYFPYRFLLSFDTRQINPATYYSWDIL